MGEVVPARTSLTLHPPSPPTVHQLSRLALYLKESEFTGLPRPHTRTVRVKLLIHFTRCNMTKKLHSIPYNTVNPWNLAFNPSIIVGLHKIFVYYIVTRSGCWRFLLRLLPITETMLEYSLGPFILPRKPSLHVQAI